MHARGEIHSFGSAMARDELARLLEGASCCADPASAQLLFEHLEAGLAAGAPARRTGSGRTMLSIAMKLCDLLPSVAFRGKERDDSDRRLRS